MLKEVHVKVILTLHSFLCAQLKDVAEVAGGIKPQINHRVSNTEEEHRRKTRQIILLLKARVQLGSSPKTPER